MASSIAWLCRLQNVPQIAVSDKVEFRRGGKNGRQGSLRKLIEGKSGELLASHAKIGKIRGDAVRSRRSAQGRQAWIIRDFLGRELPGICLLCTDGCSVIRISRRRSSDSIRSRRRLAC